MHHKVKNVKFNSEQLKQAKLIKMHPTHNSASELNIINDDSVIVNDLHQSSELMPTKRQDKNSSPSTTVGLLGRRQSGFELPPIATNLQTNEVTNEDEPDVPASALLVNKSSKFITIGFNDLTFAVKTGLWKRGNFIFLLSFF